MGEDIEDLVRVDDDRTVIDVDHMSVGFARESRGLVRSLQQRCPVAWSTSHGGYWLITDYKSAAEVLRDDGRFSSAHDIVDPASPLKGIGIPETLQHVGLIEMDPPEHRMFRKPWQRLFSPGAVSRWEPRMRELASRMLDDVIESGHIDLVKDYTVPIPALVILEYLGLSLDNWQDASDAIHGLVSTHPKSPQYTVFTTAWEQLSQRIQREIVDRKASPRDDVISTILASEIESGVPYPEDVLHGDIMAFLAGGVDTTTALASFAFLYLGRHPQERQLLVDNRDLRDAACEEFLRYSSPITTIARTITEDTQLSGQSLREGDRLLVCFPGANLDDAEFPEGDKVVLSRTPNRHIAFGLGVHRCIGSNIARVDVRAMLDEILDRIPEYVIDESSVEPYPGIGKVNGYLSIRATFEPRPRRHSRRT
jgi:cytochrome P450